MLYNFSIEDALSGADPHLQNCSHCYNDAQGDYCRGFEQGKRNAAGKEGHPSPAEEVGSGLGHPLPSQPLEYEG